MIETPGDMEPPSRPGMNRGVTIALSAVIGFCLLSYAGAVLNLSRLDWLSAPRVTAVHVMERHVDLAEAALELPAPLRWLVAAETPAEARAVAAEAYAEVLEAELDVPDDLEADVVRDHLRTLDRERPADPALVSRLALFGTCAVLVLGAGVVSLVVWLRRGRRWPQLGTGAGVAPWTLGEGYAVAVRSAALAAGVLIVFVVLPSLVVWGTLLASLPMIWLVRRRLLLPRGLRLRDAFGLRLSGSPRTLVFVSLGAFAAGFLGETVIAELTSLLGADPHWAEMFLEDLLFGSWGTVVLDSIDGVAWAPLFEEIGFRGLVYPTLRTRFRVGPAALLSAALFSVVHFYSWTGFLALAWTGLVWAVLYEKTRSLWPCILCHALNNLFALGALLLFYR